MRHLRSTQTKVAHWATAGLFALILVAAFASNAWAQTVVATIPIPTTQYLSRPAVDPARHRVYVNSQEAFYASTLFVVDTDTNAIIQTIPLIVDPEVKTIFRRQ